MKEIPLSKGYVAIVDDDDYDELSKYKWTVQDKGKLVYALRMMRDENNKRVTILMHRQILKPSTSKLFIDHINSNGLDNQKVNLRIATASQNQKNKRSAKGSSSKYLGVHLNRCKHTYKGKVTIYESWRASIKVNKRTVSLGSFKLEEDAAKAYNEAAVKFHGEFANLNIIEVDKESILSKDNLV